MKTERLTMLVTPAEKERITEQAKALGLSASEYVRKAADLLDAEDISVLEAVHALLPEFNSAISRIHENLAAALDHVVKHEREISRMRTLGYRRRVAMEIAADGDTLAAAAGLFAGEDADQDAKPRAGEPDGTLVERSTRDGGGDPHYAEWRRRQIEELDRDYQEYVREHSSKFEQDFGKWRQLRRRTEPDRDRNESEPPAASKAKS